MIRVLLVDDQNLVRLGISSLLELSDNIEVQAEAVNGEEALYWLKENNPDVILLDLQMPKMDGLEFLKVMVERNLEIPVIVLTTFDDPQRLIECSRLGAKGYLLKDVSLQQLVSAIETVHEGGTIIQPTLTVNILNAMQNKESMIEAQKKSVPSSDALSSRETEILRFLAGGFSNREVAKAISLSEGTVKNHVSSILAKLAVRDRTRAVLKAIELGLIG